MLDLFDKLVSPILNFGSEVWGFAAAANIERVHLRFCKKRMGVKQSTQNDFIYGELGRKTFVTSRYYNIIKYWLKILCVNELKYNKLVYDLLISDSLDHPNKSSWVTLLTDLLSSFGFWYA